MPTAPVPFVNALQSGDEELAGASPQALNVTVDGAGAVRRRPGLARYNQDTTAQQAPTALHAAEDGTVFAVTPRAASGFALDVQRVTTGGATLVGSMVGQSRPQLVETEMLLVIAAGQSMYKVLLATPTSISLLGGNPPQATHVILNNSSLMGNDVTANRAWVRFSAPATGSQSFEGHELWNPSDGGGVFAAEGQPDPVVALGENTNEIWVFGSRTLQLYAPTQTADIFSAVVTMEVGCAAPYSVIKREDQFYWLDHARRFVSSSGRGTQTLSSGLQRVIQGFARVDDCFGYRVLLGSLDGVAWTFPTEGRTFFMQDGAGWAEWTSWDTRTSQPKPFVVTAHTYARNTGLNLVGLPLIGVGILQSGLATDVGTMLLAGAPEDPEPIKAEVTTGFLNRGTDARKYCRSLRLTFRRGSGTRKPEIRGYVRWRDSPGAWEPPIPVVLDGMQPVCEINSLGTYRRRQWRYSFSDEAEDLALTGAEEDFEITG